MERYLRSLAAIVEVRVLAGWVALGGTIWLFLQLAGEVTEGDTDALDRKLFFLMRVHGRPTEPIGPPWLQEAMRDVTALGGFTLVTTICVAGVVGLLLYKRFRHAVVLAGTTIGAQLSADMLKMFYDRARPDLVLHTVRVYSQSFPSGHSTTATATYFTIAVMVSTLDTQRRAKLFAFFLAGLVAFSVGVSRVYLGVHWPSDVIAGWTVGGSWALGAWMVLSRPPSPHLRRE
ncbi:MAG: phosphatase PAP2 family protein [Alphaproteobacteria bacterium]|nr:phosphatase PAP2 family protein [Alphaproteobacteria bacterium]